jgi:hypothetical protein
MADWSVLGDLPGVFFGARDRARKARLEEETDRSFKELADNLLRGETPGSSSSSTGETRLGELGTRPPGEQITEGPPLPPQRPQMAPSMASGRGLAGGRTMQMPTDPALTAAIEKHARAIGADPVDLATVMSYETGGTFTTDRTANGRIGLIQFGAPESKRYGAAPGQSYDEQVAASARYLVDRGFKPGMGILDLYSTINAGRPGLYHLKDEKNGGAPGTVRDKVNSQMAGHRARAEAMFRGSKALVANSDADVEALERGDVAGAYAGRPIMPGLDRVQTAAAPAARPSTYEGGGDDPAAEIVRLREIAGNENTIPSQREWAVARLKELGTVGAPGATGPTAEAGDRPATRPPGTVGAFAGLPGTDNTVAGPAPTPVPAATVQASPPPPPPRAGDQQSRALVALMLRNPSTRGAGIQAMLSMQRKGASSPFEYLGGVAQYDGDGKVHWLVQPPPRKDPNETVVIEGKLVNKHTGRLVADHSKPPGLHNAPAGTDVIDPQTKQVIHSTPRADDDKPELKTVGDSQHWLRRGEKPTKENYAGPAQARHKELTVHELKQIDDAENERIGLESTMSNLNRALELNPKIYDGFFSGVRTSAANKLTPGLAELVADPERGKATATWNSLMRKEAIEQMASTLKGATTDKELQSFVDILADGSQPESVREETLKRMQFLAGKKLELQLKKVEQIRGREFYKPGGGSDTKPAASATPVRKPLPEGYSAARVLSEAKEAAKRASPEQKEALRAKLEEFGISGERLD